MIISEWPVQERPREKLLHLGASALSDAELLAILFGKGICGQNALDLARSLLKQYGSLQALLTCSFEQLRQHKGLGLAKYSQLQAAVELHRRCLQEPLQRVGSITQPKDANDFFIANLRGCEQEIFAGLFLDNQHCIIRFEKLFYGTINHANIHPREVVKKALCYNAVALIVAHNHPSGNPKPSKSDLYITVQLQKALELVEIRLLDHIIIGDTKTVSLAENGLL